LYVELAEEILHARPEDENEAKAALEWVRVREGKQLAEWIERRRRLLGTPLSAVCPGPEAEASGR